MRQKLLKLTLLLCILIVGGNTWAEETFTLATSLSVGDEVVLVNNDVSKELSGISSTSTPYGTPEPVTNSNPKGLYLLTVVAGKATGSYALKTTSNTYLTWKSGNSLTTEESITDNSSWKITFSEEEIEITNIKDNSRKLKYNASSPRFACYTSAQTAVKLYKKGGGGDTPALKENDLALTGAPIALSFDLHNNSQAQVIHYTTSSTGEVSVEAGANDVSCSVDGTNKTITVTPIAVTNGKQTVTVNQAADGTYKAGSVTFTVTVTDSTPIVTHTATFSVNGATTTADYVEGAEIEFPAAPQDVSGKTFVGWATAAIDGTTDEAPEFVTSAQMGDSDVTFYAVFAYVNGSYSEVTDVLNRELTGVTGSSYTDWSGKTSISDAVYAGQSAGDNNSIQLRSKDNNSGIVTTTSGGKAKKVVVTWNSNTTDGRTIYVYGKNQAYSSASELYNDATDGDLLAEVAKGTSEVTISKDYEYIGIRSKSGALYLSEVQITWQTGGGVTYSDYCTTVSKVATFSYLDYQGQGTKDTGSEYTMIETDVRITHNKFYGADTGTCFYGYGDVGEGLITITPTGGATITRIEITTPTEYNGYQVDGDFAGEITASVGTVTANNEDKTKATMTTWTGSASEQFTITNTRTIVWTSIKVYYTGGLSKCATPAISGDTPFITYSTVSITCATEGATIQYRTSTDGVNYTDYQTYTGPFQISQTTTVKAQATKEGMVPSDEAYKGFVQQGVIPNIGYFISSHATVAFADPEYLQLEDALVTYKNGTTAYIEDAFRAIMLYNCAGDLEAGDKINGYMKVTGYNPSYNGLPEITAFELVEGYTKTSGNVVNPTVVTIAQLMGGAEDNPYEMYLSKYVKIENATVTSAFASKNSTIEQGGYSITLRDQNSSATLTSNKGDNVTITGIVSIYNTTKQIAVYEQSQIEVTSAPIVASIDVSTTSVEAPAAGADGTIEVTYNNIIKDVAAEVFFCDAEGKEATYDWIVAEINKDNNIEYVIDANTGVARTAYLKVYALDDEANDVYSELITISQAAYVEPATVSQYALFTGDLVEGDYIIYYKGKAMNTTVDKNRLQYEEVTPENDVITTDNASIVWHIAKSGDYWTIYSVKANAYAASTGTKNQAKTMEAAADDHALWTVEGTETYEFVNKYNAEKSINANLRNNSDFGFACYADGTGGALSLYKKVLPVTSTSLTLNAYGFATFASTEALDFTGYATADYKAWQATSTESSTLKFTQITSTVKAGTGILITGTAGATITLTTATEGEDISATNLLVGFTEATAVADDEYFGLSGDEFVKVKAGTIPAGKALLPASVVGTSVKSFSFAFEGNATGIKSLSDSPLQGETIVNLAGQRLQKIQKGINIVNGKKVLY